MFKVTFTGEVLLPFADDRGSYDIWLVQAIKAAVLNAKHHDDVFDELKLSWELSE